MAETLEHTKNQFTFLQRACDAFDNGSIADAQNIAHHLRVLLYRSRTSHPLLEQVGVLDTLTILDMAGDLLEDAMPHTEVPLVAFRVGVDQAGLRGELSYLPAFRADPKLRGLEVYQIHDLREGREAPRLKDGRYLPAETWWQQPVIRDSHGKLFSRRMLVEMMANTDGGSHVDPTIDTDYYALSRLNSLSIHVGSKRDFSSIVWSMGQPLDPAYLSKTASGSPVPACLRHIAWELTVSVRSQCPQIMREFT